MPPPVDAACGRWSCLTGTPSCPAARCSPAIPARSWAVLGRAGPDRGDFGSHLLRGFADEQPHPSVVLVRLRHLPVELAHLRTHLAQLLLHLFPLLFILYLVR